MNRRTVAKRCLKMFGYKIPVKWFTDYAIELDINDNETPKCLYVQLPNQSISEVENAQREYFKTLNVPVSYDLFAILHEIGHLQSEQNDYNDYEIDLELIEKLYKMNKIDANQYISIYNSLENEKNANDWAINWINNNINTAKMLENLLN